DLHADVKKVTDRFFTPGSDITNFLDAFVRGEVTLPVTTGPIRGLPRAWRRGFGKPPENRPSLLFMDLPDPSTPDSTSRNHAAGSILDLVKENNRPVIPVFGVSGCGKTRAVIELLSQHWGFYFNASNDDWGSDDMMTLRSAYCLNAFGSSESFTSARWTLLQVCPHVLFDQDIFNMLFLQLLKLRHYRESDLWDFVRAIYEDTKVGLIKHGCLPKINDNTRLLVVHDEAQVLGDEFDGSFQSTTSTDSPRPLLSPILHAFRDIGQHQLTLVTCGTGLSINTLFWIQSSGSGLKDSSTTFE
ncbi:hypothetical protein BGX23_004397, partial [Mortierella sp. AD031]